MFVFVLYLAETAFRQDAIKFVGWEKNAKGIFCPKYVDLSKTMDSTKFVYLKTFYWSCINY